MRLILGTLLMLFLSRVITESFTKRQLKFLDRLIKIIEKDRTIQMINVLQNSKDKNCTLRDWNPENIPILRSNERSAIALRGTFNNIALALVCMDNDSDGRLLIHLAKIYESMRQKHIILWMQRQPSEDFRQLILRQVEEFKFSQMLILQIGKYLPVIHRMDMHPSPHFVRIANISSRQYNVFFPKIIDFMGRKAIVDANVVNPNGVSFTRVDGREVFEFARKYNLTLKLCIGNQTDAGSFDFQLAPQILSKNTLEDHLAYVSPLFSASLIVMVPCGQERSLKEIFKQLDVRTWLFYIFCVYALLVLVETFIIMVTYRMLGRDYRATGINLFVNLRAFRAILAMPFPVSSRDTLSLRQLFLAMSIFGMVFSTFFNCKLSALLMKHSHYPQVTNFKELRASGMTVIVDEHVRSYIEADLQADFFRRVVPIAMTLARTERAKLLVSMNESYAHIIFKENWPHINHYQISNGRKAFCISPDLGIIDNIPITSILQKDSIYKMSLTRTLTRLYESGISQLWIHNKYYNAKRAMHLEISTNVTPKLVPLSLEHLKLLWYLLLLGHGMAAVVFFLEVFFNQVKKRNRWPRYTGNESVL
ncbi:hypothetical protein KR038_001001 [Drosophila bunnanda]|nr:hypothetical protein KR038_001001 [Drosophila bunnanda]